MDSVEELQKELKKEKRKNIRLTQAINQNKSIHEKYNESTKKLRIQDEELKTLNNELEKKVEEKTSELKQLVQRFDFAIKGSNDGLWDWNIIDGNIFYSKRWKEMLGFKEEELGNNLESWSTRIHPDDYDSCMADIEKSLAGEIDYFENEHRLLHKNGSWVWVRDKGKTFYDKKGQAIRMAGFHTDITASKEKEQIIKEKEALLFAQSKMAIMGEMLENIAHQWRQPLSAISSTSTGLVLKKEMQFLEDEEFFKSLDQINETAQDLSKTIDEFRDFFIANQANVLFDIQIALEKTKKLLHFEFDKIEIIEKIDSLKIKGSELEMVQILMNLLTNSRNEFETNGIFEKVIEIEAFEKNNKGHISIRDNAGGIPLEILGKIFQPYFTTREQIGGTGVGLHMSKSIIEEHFNGEIQVENQQLTYKEKEYTGACFTIILPSV